MRHASFVGQVEGAFWPTHYETVVEPPPGLDLLLTVKRGPARYALAVGRQGAVAGGLRAWRGLVAQALGARWLWREVGLFLVLTGDAASWDPALKADRTGFHAVIVQAVQLVDLAAGRSELRAARWGPVVFGGSAVVGERIDGLLDGEPPESVLP